MQEEKEINSETSQEINEDNGSVGGSGFARSLESKEIAIINAKQRVEVIESINGWHQ